MHKNSFSDTVSSKLFASTHYLYKRSQFSVFHQ